MIACLQRSYPDSFVAALLDTKQQLVCLLLHKQSIAAPTREMMLKSKSQQSSIVVTSNDFAR